MNTAISSDLPTQPVPPSTISNSLNKFFEQAEIWFITLSQPNRLQEQYLRLRS
ncbi:hypothetical protein PGT21_012057 [Puccinia graminis f. sp. tritici]|uniref:Uncharacterized protein n=1 Tax=Puccinia graminis f. sp. tritici TaxID=56615 RepID=A0A5B0MXI2_PUCGR|nr:hypothetical protein PGT21_012057 [Puccinia graminis f. sp. tritici]